jgi:lactate dehydrogenase-like 2-hydroxyacid dehydrogenase
LQGEGRTREVADHAIALMMTLAKSIAYHDSELRNDLKGNWRPAHNPFGRRLSVCTRLENCVNKQFLVAKG